MRVKNLTLAKCELSNYNCENVKSHLFESAHWVAAAVGPGLEFASGWKLVEGEYLECRQGCGVGADERIKRLC